ncbi:MAG TPA: tetratricopeptide repeat protein [Vicinamibacterales bacterium]
MGRFFLLVVLVAGSQAPPQNPPPRPPSGPGPTEPAQTRQRPDRPRVSSATGVALDRYLQGDYAGAIAYLMPLGGFNVMLAQDWINAGGSAAVDRRRLTAATMVLEYTAARPNLSPPLIEWACEQLAKYPAPALEQTWLRASIALVEGRQAWTILTGETASHLAHARERFPNNAHFKLAEAVAAEATASDPSVRAPSGDRGMVIDLISAEMLHGPSDRTSRQAARLQQAAATLEQLLTEESIAAEARLRLGYIQLRLGHPDVALQHFQKVGSSGDASLKYLARLFAGWTLAADGRVDEAAARYRAALEVVPRARSASTLLTMLLVMNHRLADAEEIAAALMSTPEPADDPWRGYKLGSYRVYQTLIDRLHEAIR